MKTPYISIFYIKIFILFFSLNLFAFGQEDATESKSDTLVFKQKYGLRLGADISKLVRTAIDDDYSGFELRADYRLTKKIYVAGELGFEEKTTDTDAINLTAEGSYFKAGLDYNFYQNWLDMENMIFSGIRVGASTFSQTRNSFSVYNVNNQYWNNQVTVIDGEKFDGLTALWLELIAGIRAEIFNNFFMGANVQLKFLINETSSDDFENLFIPGFNRTYDSGRIGAGFTYTISYLIPIFKKDKIVVQESDSNE